MQDNTLDLPTAGSALPVHFQHASPAIVGSLEPNPAQPRSVDGLILDSLSSGSRLAEAQAAHHIPRRVAAPFPLPQQRQRAMQAAPSVTPVLNSLSGQASALSCANTDTHPSRLRDEELRLVHLFQYVLDQRTSMMSTAVSGPVVRSKVQFCP